MTSNKNFPYNRIIKKSNYGNNIIKKSSGASIEKKESPNIKKLSDLYSSSKKLPDPEGFYFPTKNVDKKALTSELETPLLFKIKPKEESKCRSIFTLGRESTLQRPVKKDLCSFIDNYQYPTNLLKRSKTKYESQNNKENVPPNLFFSDLNDSNLSNSSSSIFGNYDRQSIDSEKSKEKTKITIDDYSQKRGYTVYHQNDFVAIPDSGQRHLIEKFRYKDPETRIPQIIPIDFSDFLSSHNESAKSSESKSKSNRTDSNQFYHLKKEERKTAGESWRSYPISYKNESSDNEYLTSSLNDSDSDDSRKQMKKKMVFNWKEAQKKLLKNPNSEFPNKRNCPPEFEISQKAKIRKINSEKRVYVSSIFFINEKTKQKEGFRLYNDKDIGFDNHFQNKIQEAEYDDDCQTDDEQIEIAIKDLQKELTNALITFKNTPADRKANLVKNLRFQPKYAKKY